MTRADLYVESIRRRPLVFDGAMGTSIQAPT